MSIIDYEKIQREYDHRRVQNLNIAEQRREEILAKFPEIKAIMEEQADLNLEATTASIFNMPIDEAALTEKNAILSAKKEELLTSHGYDANYLKPVFHCHICSDTGITPDGDSCSCFNKLFIEQLYQQSNVKHLLETAGFDKFSLDYYSKEQDSRYLNGPTPYKNASNVLNTCKSFVSNFKKEFNNLFIYGETGLGKTFLTLCIAKDLIANSNQVLYLSSSILFNKVLAEVEMNHSEDPGVLAMYRYVSSCDLLIIDDLGTEFTNTYVTSKLFELINDRTARKLSTIISSNLNLKEVSERYSERINSRIIESYTVLPMYGNNIRYINAKKKLTQKAND